MTCRVFRLPPRISSLTNLCGRREIPNPRSASFLCSSENLYFYLDRLTAASLTTHCESLVSTACLVEG